VSSASLNRPLYSGELARLSGMSADTVRHYERHGLLPAAPRSASGYRPFPREALVRMQIIRAALSIGFSVSELSDIFRERRNGGAPCRRVRDMAAAQADYPRISNPRLAVLAARFANHACQMGQPASPDASRGKGSIIGSLGCNSPEEPHSKVKSWRAGSR
jgi:DNA-binding transcriptional MerR regulator